MNRPNHAITWMIAAMSVAACLGTASLGPARSGRPVVRLQDPPVQVAGPTARDLRLQAMHRLMTPVQTVLPQATVPVVQVNEEVLEVAAVETAALSNLELEATYESSCGRDQATGEVYSAPTEESAEPTAAEESTEAPSNEEARKTQVRRPVWSATVRQGGRPTFIIYRRPSLVLKTETQVRYERSTERMRAALRSAVTQLSLGSWPAVANAWVEPLNLPWEQLTAADVEEVSAELPPDRESRANPAYRSVLRNRTLQ